MFFGGPPKPTPFMKTFFEIPLYICIVMLSIMSTNKQNMLKKSMERCTPQRSDFESIETCIDIKMFPHSFLPSYMLFPDVLQPCQVQPMPLCAATPQRRILSGFPVFLVASAGKFNLSVSCCMSHVLPCLMFYHELYQKDGNFSLD